MKIEEYENRIKNRGYVEDHLEKGITTEEIENIQQTSDEIIKQKNRIILKEHIKDEMIREIMLEEENLKKLARKGRYEHRTTGYNSNGEIIIELTCFNKTTREIKEAMKLAFEKQNKTEYMKKVLEQLGWNAENIRIIKNEQIKKTITKIIFRKG